jgi:hypothetical protein
LTYLSNDGYYLSMKYIILLIVMAAVILPLTPVAYSQNILDQMGRAFNDLTSDITGSGNNSQGSSVNNTNQSSNGQTPNGTSGQSTSEVAQGISNVSDITNATGSNKMIFANNTDIDSNVSTLTGMEKSQMGNAIPGEQNAKFEGQQIQNVTQN